MTDSEKAEPKKKIKDFTKEEMAEYRHNAYLKRREADKARQRKYYAEHKEEIKMRANKRYRIKCGLRG